MQDDGIFGMKNSQLPAQKLQLCQHWSFDLYAWIPKSPDMQNNAYEIAHEETAEWTDSGTRGL